MVREQDVSGMARAARTARLAGLALALGLTAGIMASVPAQAQFICQDVTTGTADGATATGTPSMACGTNAAASGDLSTAIGNGAQLRMRGRSLSFH